MSFRYTDEMIPKRPFRDGGSRPSFRVRSTDMGMQAGGSWTMITQEELFSGRRTQRERLEIREAPGPFADLLKMTKDYQVTEKGRTEAFLKQARKMESYTEEGPVQDVGGYHAFIGYQEMNPQELHNYFAWRTKFRKGERVPLSVSFLLLHAAELINLVGARDEQDAFDRLLKCVQTAYAAPGSSRKRTFAGTGLRRPDPGGVHPGLRSAWTDLADHMNLALSKAELERLEKIIQGFVISWGPAPEIVQEYCIPDLEREWDNVTLCHLAGSDDASIYRVISHLVERRTLNSAFREEAGEDVWRVTARVFRRICLEREQELQSAYGPEARLQAKKDSLAQRLLGERKELARDIFPWIPFQPRVKEGYHIEISPVTSYTYRGGKWYRSACPVMRSEDALRDLNELVRECERVLRRKLRFRSQLSDRLHDPRLVKLIEEEYDRWIREKELRSRPEIHVDLSRLGPIREQAAITRDRLLEGTEEGAWEDALNAAVALNNAANTVLNVAVEESAETGTNHKAAAPETKRPAPEMDDDGIRETGNPSKESLLGIFDREESIFLRLLMDGESGKDYFRTHKILPSVFVDAINEKAYDEIGDSIVEEDGAGWRLVEDYIEDVRDLLGDTESHQEKTEQ